MKLQSSMNGVIWTDVNAGALEDARYVRLYNAGNETQNVSVQEFKVTYAFIGEKTVESDFAQKDSANDMRSNAWQDHRNTGCREKDRIRSRTDCEF